MKKYNYKEEMKKDIQEYAEFENINIESLDADELCELCDELWTVDSVTGNGSGSYTFNRWIAEEYVMDNMPLAIAAYREFGSLEEFANDIETEDFEKIDVTIRCFLLNNIVYSLAIF